MQATRTRRAEHALSSKIIEMERRGVSTSCLKSWIGEAKHAARQRARDREALECYLAASSLPPEEAIRHLQELEPDLGADVSEVWSPPRLTAKARRAGLVPGAAIDFITGYDVLTATGRSRAWATLMASPPRVLVLSPPCHAFSSLLRLCKKFRGSVKHVKILAEGLRHLKFMTKLARCKSRMEGTSFSNTRPAPSRGTKR